MNPQEAAQRAGVLAWFANQVKEQTTPARDDAKSALQEMGIRSMTARLDGVDVADLILKRGALRANVTDERALFEWVAENYPSEVVRSIRPAFLAKLLQDARTAKAPVDARTGEVVPGLEVVEGSESLQVSPRVDAGPTILAALRDGRISPLALPGGES